MAEKSYWLSSGIYTLLDRLVQLVFGFGFISLTARLLSDTDHGQWVLFLMLTTFIEVTRTGLLQNSMVSFINIYPAKYHAKINTASTVLNLGLSVICVALIFIFRFIIASFFNAPALVSMLPIYAITTFAFSALYQFNFVQQAYMDYKGLFWSSFVKQGMMFGYILYHYITNTPVQLVHLALFQLVTSIPSALVAYSFAKPHLSFSNHIDVIWLKKLFRYGQYTMGTNFATMLHKKADSLMIGRLLEKKMVSIYEIAIRITNLAEVPTFALATILFPKSAQQKNDKEGIARLYEKSVGSIFAILLPFIVGILLFADILVLIIGSAKFTGSIPVLRMTIFYGLFIPCAVQFGTVVDSIGRPKINFWTTLLGAGLNLTLNYFFIQKYGLYGAVYGSFVAYIIMFVVMQWILNKLIGTNILNIFKHIVPFYTMIWEFVSKKLNPQKAVINNEPQ
jgi:lipopolysaccharide exporter